MAVTIAGKAFVLDPRSVTETMGQTLPEPLTDHFAVVGGRRFPPKQVVATVTGVDRADFTSHHARRILRRLGFSVGRRSAQAMPRPDPGLEGPYGGAQAEALRPYVGKWVALRGPEVLVAADAPEDVVAWLQEHDVPTDGMLRVPARREDMEGGGPF